MKILSVRDAKLEGRDEVEIWGSGSPRRDFLPVDDLTDSIRPACDCFLGHGASLRGAGTAVV